MTLAPVDAVARPSWALLVEDETKELPTVAAELVALDRLNDTGGDDLIGKWGVGPLLEITAAAELSALGLTVFEGAGC